MRVCYFGSYQKYYERNKVIIKGLRRVGVSVQECHAPIWGEVRDKTMSIRGRGSMIKLLLRFAAGYLLLIKRYLSGKDHDVVVVGYLGHLDVFLARILAAIKRKPVVFDAFLSLYDLVAVDKRIVKINSLVGRLFFLVDKLACRVADKVLLDTDQHIEYFCKEFELDRRKFAKIPVGADDANFYPRQVSELSQEWRVLYFGKYIPLHGVKYILEAAHKLKDREDIQFEFVGSGQLYEECRGLAKSYRLTRVLFTDRWMEPTELAERISKADVCLGVFGETPKARRVIPNKIYTTLAMRKPLITGECPAVKELLTDRKNVFLCEMADPQSLAEAILFAKDNPSLSKGIAEAGYRLYRSSLRPHHIGGQVARVLADCLNSKGRRRGAFDSSIH